MTQSHTKTIKENIAFLESLLLKALESNESQEIQFVKNNIYKKYLAECSDAWEIPDQRVLSAYN